jgi:hypothetical protein
MKTTLRSLSYLLLFLTATALLSGAAPEMPMAGKFLVLRSGRTLEGDIQRIDDQYRVRRNGGETWIPANMVLRLFLDTDDAYKFLRGKMLANDPDEHLRLAAWCLEANLRERATDEALEADHLRPNDPETKRFLSRLQKLASMPAPAPLPAPAPQELDMVPTLNFDMTPESIGQFTQKVQPILINACASCHANNRGVSFKLMRTTEVPTLNRRALQENLTAVLGQINPVQPLASPLLTKAVTIHGGDRAPFRNRHAVPYQVLEDWVKTTLANNPQLLERLGGSVAPVHVQAPSMPETKSLFAAGKSDALVPGEPPRPNVVPITVVPPAAPLPRSAPQTPTATPPDSSTGAGDPEEFNRQAYPERYQTPAPKP